MRAFAVRPCAPTLAACALLLAAPLPAGELEPPGPPAPTMKSLDEVPPTWSQLLDSTDGDPQSGCDSTRFRCVMNGEAVLDRETGLVWERSAPVGSLGGWTSSLQTCASRTTGGRAGWRLPSLEELRSLVDPEQSEPALPPGHPFVVDGPGLVIFWTSTTDWSDPTSAAVVSFDEAVWSFSAKNILWRGPWCVRGGPPNTFSSRP